jgi:hypothetical protein
LVKNYDGAGGGKEMKRMKRVFCVDSPSQHRCIPYASPEPSTPEPSTPERELSRAQELIFGWKGFRYNGLTVGGLYTEAKEQRERLQAEEERKSELEREAVERENKRLDLTVGSLFKKKERF